MFTLKNVARKGLRWSETSRHSRDVTDAIMIKQLHPKLLVFRGALVTIHLEVDRIFKLRNGDYVVSRFIMQKTICYPTF